VRILAVLESRPSDADVVRRAVEAAVASGGYLTLLSVVPRAFPFVNASPWCCPRVTAEELRRQAETSLARAAALVPDDVPLLTRVDQGRPRKVAARHAKHAACDLVVTRRTLIPKEA
jgi:hypothetical protein